MWPLPWATARSEQQVKHIGGIAGSSEAEPEVFAFACVKQAAFIYPKAAGSYFRRSCLLPLHACMLHAASRGFCTGVSACGLSTAGVAPQLGHLWCCCTQPACIPLTGCAVSLCLQGPLWLSLPVVDPGVVKHCGFRQLHCMVSSSSSSETGLVTTHQQQQQNNINKSTCWSSGVIEQISSIATVSACGQQRMPSAAADNYCLAQHRSLPQHGHSA